MTVSPADSSKFQSPASNAAQAPDGQPVKPSDQHASPDKDSTSPPQQPGGEEPALALEPDLPSDGCDAVGEAMIRDLPQRPELSEPPSQPDPSSQPT